MTADDVIADYRAAYEEANGRPLFHIWYERGWFKIRSEPHGYIVKQRRSGIEEMTATLRRRISNP